MLNLGNVLISLLLLPSTYAFFSSRLSIKNSVIFQRQDSVVLQLNRIEFVHTPEAIYQPQNQGNLMTLSRFMIEATRSNPDHADFESLIESIQIACKMIANLLSKANNAQANRIPLDETIVNKSIYMSANNILKNALKFTGKLGVITSESDESPVLVEEAWNSKYIAVFDPLDGVSNSDVGIAAGTIFGIFKEDEECLLDFGEEVGKAAMNRLLKNLQPADNLVAAGYCIYSSTTVLMISLGDGVHGFTLDPNIGEFILTHPNVKVPSRGRIYSMNEARSPWWPSGLTDYINNIKQGNGQSGLTYTSRYIGSLVADFHRTLLKGGIFGYPGDSKGAPQGKLRLIHEVAPLAFLIEQAGGKASTGYGPIMDVHPVSLNEHVSTFLGSIEDVKEVEKYLNDNKVKAIETP
eukprot:gene14476-19432_t